MIKNLINSTNSCPLCNSPSSVFYQFKEQFYHQCNNCWGIFVDKSLIASREAEMLRYQKHQNDVEDDGYRNFVSPVTSAISRLY